MKKNAKIILVFYAVLLISASTLSTHALAGDLLYSKGFTQSQRVQVKDCFKQDITFPSQVNKLTSEGDIAISPSEVSLLTCEGKVMSCLKQSFT